MSLIEVVIAVFVLAVGIIPVVNVFSQGYVGTILTRDEILAHSYASELIDYAQALGFDQLKPSEYNPKEMPSIPGGVDIDTTKFRRFLTVTGDFLPPGNADWPIDYKVLKAEIKWKSSGIEQYFVLTSLLFKGRKP